MANSYNYFLHALTDVLPGGVIFLNFAVQFLRPSSSSWSFWLLYWPRSCVRALRRSCSCTVQRALRYALNFEKENPFRLSPSIEKGKSQALQTLLTGSGIAISWHSLSLLQTTPFTSPPLILTVSPKHRKKHKRKMS